MSDKLSRGVGPRPLLPRSGVKVAAVERPSVIPYTVEPVRCRGVPRLPAAWIVKGSRRIVAQIVTVECRTATARHAISEEEGLEIDESAVEKAGVGESDSNFRQRRREFG